MIPSMHSHKVENGAERVEMDSWGKCVTVVNTGDLQVALHNQLGFVVQDLTIWAIFDGIGPA